jgi:hypothetical protein
MLYLYPVHTTTTNSTTYHHNSSSMSKLHQPLSMWRPLKRFSRLLTSLACVRQAF